MSNNQANKSDIENEFNTRLDLTDLMDVDDTVTHIPATGHTAIAEHTPVTGYTTTASLPSTPSTTATTTPTNRYKLPGDSGGLKAHCKICVPSQSNRVSLAKESVIPILKMNSIQDDTVTHIPATGHTAIAEHTPVTGYTTTTSLPSTPSTTATTTPAKSEVDPATNY
ncbi:hypothetical protein PROFUN_15229 [Planoprotostelium fungivorum]|uniref:Uncharacterized protein n=1 Tax=Planoprotostelium fungivorum TaxID=1890364 RepID=A0A2P6MWT8_9EUKA|nr:hypothetical protein PROFUN_15229 [Planoprotostelium fungivorum]